MRSHHPTLLACAAMLALTATARGQQDGKPTATDTPRPVVKLKEPVEYRVYQRDRDDRASIPVSIDVTAGGEGYKILDASIATVGGAAFQSEGTRFEDGKLVNVPVGGPYSVSVNIQTGKSAAQEVTIGSIYVGDLWVMAGQSNMEGVGDLVDVTPPNSQVTMLGMNGKWSRAEEPLHWLVDSPDPVHSGDPDNREKRAAELHKTRTKGAGLGLPFATALTQSTGIPIGLVAAAHGGTSMAQWDPAKKGDGGNSLYGSMIRQVNLAGGKVKGVIWYQGESDALTNADKAFPKAFADFITAVRSDFGQPELPFYYVQIGRFIHAGDPKPWNAVQDAQRLLAEQVPNTAVVSVIDLELDDLIHVGTQGLKRAGHRLARVAERELFGRIGATTPTLDRVNKGAGNTLVVKFKGVNIGGSGARGGMGGMGGGMGGMGGGTAPGQAGGFRQMAVQGQGMGGMAMGGMGAIVGLKPSRHIAGFSVRKEDGTEIPLIFDAAVGSARDTVILKLIGPLPEKAFLWYGHGFDPYCNLTDALDMAVPVFGPVALDDLK